MRVFCLVAELRSFTAAAARLGMSTTMASKHVVQLERHLNCRLLHRTSRRVGLTDMGGAYHRELCRLLGELDAIGHVVGGRGTTPPGSLRVSGPVWLANEAFARLLAGYRETYSDVTLEVDLSGRLVNLVDEGFDVALRMTRTLEDGLIARTIGKVTLHLVAAPVHLDRHGRPQDLAELEGARLLNYSLSAMRDTVRLRGAAGEGVTVPFRTVLSSNNEILLHRAALEGIGMTFLPHHLIAADIAEGRLELVLPDVARLSETLYAVYASRELVSANVRTFLDFVVDNRSLVDGGRLDAPD